MNTTKKKRTRVSACFILLVLVLGGMVYGGYLLFTPQSTEITQENSVAVLDLRGPIVYGSLGHSYRSGISGVDVYNQLFNLARNPKVKAVLIYLDTPGGSPGGSHLIAEGIRICNERKPVIVHIGELSASGGVWAMVTADKIYAEGTALIGSIGVRGPTLFHFHGVVSTRGVAAHQITTDVLSAGDGKSVANPFADVDRKAIENRQQLLEDMAEKFRRHVAIARGIPLPVMKEMGAHIFSAEEAALRGLVDGIALRPYMAAVVAERIDMKPQDISFVFVSSRGTLFRSFLGTFSEEDSDKVIRAELETLPVLMMME